MGTGESQHLACNTTMSEEKAVEDSVSGNSKTLFEAEDVNELRNTDVLCGRGPHTTHPGNNNYRSLISRCSVDHKQTSHGDKIEVARKLIEEISHANGRFVERDGQGQIVKVSPERVLVKVRQALSNQSRKLPPKDHPKTALSERLCLENKSSQIVRLGSQDQQSNTHEEKASKPEANQVSSSTSNDPWTDVTFPPDVVACLTLTNEYHCQEHLPLATPVQPKGGLFVDRRIAKYFQVDEEERLEVFLGTVTENFTPKENGDHEDIWRIVYDDEETEDFTKDDLDEALSLFSEQKWPSTMAQASVCETDEHDSSVEGGGMRFIPVAVEKLRETDVLLGRAAIFYNLVGNKQYRSLVSRYSCEYELAPRMDKPEIGFKVVQTIARACPSGRFVEKDSQGTMNTVSPERAVRIVCQALYNKNRWKSPAEKRRTSTLGEAVRETASGSLKRPRDDNEDYENHWW
jgi:hypothetical protein